MVEILNFKKAATITTLNAAVTNLNVRGILLSHCGRDKNKEKLVEMPCASYQIS
jgi:hypothetical protein